jgi:Protein N-terminal asparagine amidohydrolase
MNEITVGIENCKKKSDPSFRETLLHLPSSLDYVSNTRNDFVGAYDSREFDKIDTSNMNFLNKFTTKSRTALPTTLATPIDTNGIATDAIRFRTGNQGDWSIDKQIAAGYFPILFLANTLLRQQDPLIFLKNIGEETDKPPNAIANLIQSSSGNTITSNLSSTPRVLYVAQGEIAHCTSAQVDMLVSDRATTCHILALRSSCSRHPKNEMTDEELCSIAHLDATSYSRCIRDAFQSHYDFHSRRNMYTTDSDTVRSSIDLDIHIVGGFNDTQGSSRRISTWILDLLADLADEYYVKKPSMTMMLRAACITAANHDHENGGPVVRGLALNCKTGNVFVANAKYPGPAMNLRMAKIWLSGHSPNKCDPISTSKLSVIHTHRDDIVVIEPLFEEGVRSCRCGFIQGQLQDQFQQLLRTQDDKIFLKCCSTSPEHEEEDFCSATRA